MAMNMPPTAPPPAPVPGVDKPIQATSPEDAANKIAAAWESSVHPIDVEVERTGGGLLPVYSQVERAMAEYHKGKGGGGLRWSPDEVDVRAKGYPAAGSSVIFAVTRKGSS